MLAAVDLDNQFPVQADEIDHVAIDRALPPESFAELLPAQEFPQMRFGIGHVSTQVSC